METRTTHRTTPPYPGGMVGESTVPRFNAANRRHVEESNAHDCMANAVPYVSDGALGHGFECGICGNFLQAG